MAETLLMGGFFRGFSPQSKPQAEKELAVLTAFAKEHAVDKLNAWDVAYYAEKLKEQRYAISQEALRPWFAAERVVQGMFEVVHRLYGIEVSAVTMWMYGTKMYVFSILLATVK